MTEAFGINVWPNGTATLVIDDYRLAIWESDRIDPYDRRTTTDWELLKSGARVYQGEGPSSGANGYGWHDMGDAMASLTSFLYAEDERRRYGSIEEDGSIFPDATPELIEFIEAYAEEVSLEGTAWEEADKYET